MCGHLTSILSGCADLRHVSQARQRLKVSLNEQELPPDVEEDSELEESYSDHIHGLSITPSGRLLLAHAVSFAPCGACHCDCNSDGDRDCG